MCKLTITSFLISSLLTLGFKLHKDRVVFWKRAPTSVTSSVYTPEFSQGALRPTYSSLRVAVFSKCVECHSSTGIGPADFSDYQRVISSGKVVPGNSQVSKIYQETLAGRMPLHHNPLNQIELAALRTWIDSGALNN